MCTSTSPGRTHWEGLRPARRALAAGGFTAFFDMPLNSSPPTIDGAAFDAKLQAAAAGARVDFGFWGGLVPGNLDQLEDLAERGVIGFKAFMSNSGIDEFVHARRRDALRGHGARARGWACWSPSTPRTTPLTGRARAAPAPGALPGLAPDRGRGRGDRPRDRLRRGHRLRAAHRPRLQRPRASRWWPRPARAASTSPARPARTTCGSPSDDSRRSARSPSAPRRCDPTPSAERLWQLVKTGAATWSPPTIPPRPPA